MEGSKQRPRVKSDWQREEATGSGDRRGREGEGGKQVKGRQGGGARHRRWQKQVPANMFLMSFVKKITQLC